MLGGFRAIVRCLAVSVATAATFACAQVQVATPAVEDMEHIRRSLAPTGTLRAAINYNNPLLATRDASTGEMRGIAVDLSRELARRIGAPLELVPYEAAGSISNAAASGEWDIAYLAIDPVRASGIDFTAPYVALEGTYLVRAESKLRRIEDVDRDGIRVAVTGKSAYDLFLSRELKHAELVRAASTPESIDMMMEEGLDAVAAVRTALVKAASERPGSRVMSGHFMTIPQAAGVPKGRSVAVVYMRAFIEEVKASGFVAEGLKRHGLGPNDAIVEGPSRAN